MKNDRVLEINNYRWMQPVKILGIALLVSDWLSNYVHKLVKPKKTLINDDNSQVYGFLGTRDFLDKLS